MAVQTTISQSPAVGLAGQMATTEGAEFTSSLATETIAPGLVLKFTTDSTCELADGTGAEIGLSVLDPYRTSASYVDGESVRIVTKGEIFVTLHDATGIAVGGQCYFDVATGAVSANVTDHILPNAVFLTTGAATEIVKIKLTAPLI